MAGYNSSWTSLDGDLITASLFNQEYTALDAAFDASTGHVHDGTAANGAYIPLISNAGLTEVECNATTVALSVDVGSVKTLQLTLQDGVLVPALTNDVDLGTTGNKFKDTYTTTITLGTGSAVGGILDEDDLVSDSDTSLATQQSIKAYVDNTLGATTTNIIQSPDTFNAVEVDGVSDVVITSINVTGVKTNKLRVDAAAIFPHADQDIDLGKVGLRYNNAYATNLVSNTLALSATTAVSGILDEDDMTSDSATDLATQQSIKAFVETQATLDGGSY